MRRWTHNISLVILVSLLLFLLFSNSCTKRPYLVSNIFEQIGITEDKEHKCVAIISEEKIDHFFCEPTNSSYHIRIIPYNDEKAVLTFFSDITITKNGFLDVFEKDMRQENIDVIYSLSDKNGITLLKNGKSLFLSIKSVPTERFQFDALFLVDKYIVHQESIRNRLR